MKNALSICFLFCVFVVFGQKTENFNLNTLFKNQKLSIVNRQVNAIDSSSSKYIRIKEKQGEGIVWLPLKKFKNGTISLQIRGKDEFQKSFVGIAFHGQNDDNYDAVYCRPFNFFAKDSVRRVHAIQYISHPSLTWKKLREEKNAMYEKEIINPPNPNEWFILKLLIKDRTVKAFINDSKKPSLAIEKLNKNDTGLIGIFIGDNSGGDFKNFIIKSDD